MKRNRGTPSLPFEAWPQADQEAWNSAVRPKRFRQPGGHAAHWRASTVSSYRWAYGRWLRHLCNGWPQELVKQPNDRLIEERVIAYVDELSKEVSPRSVWTYLAQLINAVQRVYPQENWDWLRNIESILRKDCPRNTLDERDLVPIETIHRLGVRLMQDAEQGRVRLDHTAPHFRNGLILVLLAETLLRIGNLAGLDLRQHLSRNGDRWWIGLSADEMKNHRPWEQTLSQKTSAILDRYLDIYRPLLACGQECSRLWLNHEGMAMKANNISDRIRRVTWRYLGKSVSPHHVRTSAATSIAIERPDLIALTPSLLGHHDPRTYQVHYNRASQVSAMDRYHASIKSALKE